MISLVCICMLDPKNPDIGLEVVCSIFTMIFFLQLLLNLVSTGILGTLKSRMIMFDVFIATLSIIDMIARQKAYTY